MSFSSEVKKELASIVPDRSCCRKAQLYGMLEAGRSFSASRITLQTESSAVADLFEWLLREICRVEPRRSENPDISNKFHTLSVPEKDCAAVWDYFGHAQNAYAVRLNRANLECDACAAAYIRGVFLACGAMTTPQIGYHMEFSIPYYHLSRDWQALFSEWGLTAREIRRKGNYVLYLKESEQIEDCLTLMGAMNASLELMNIKMVKDIRNKANRITNCESANIDKIVAAASRQVTAVKTIQRTCGIDALPDDLQELARLRLENPEYSLRELGESLAEPISRSGVNHRLNRIMEFAENL